MEFESIMLMNLNRYFVSRNRSWSYPGDDIGSTSCRNPICFWESIPHSLIGGPHHFQKTEKKQ